MPDDAPVTSAILLFIMSFLSNLMGMPFNGVVPFISINSYDERHIDASLNSRLAKVQVNSGASGDELLQRRFSQRVRKLGVIDSACQQQRADHRGNDDERVFVRAWLPPAG